MRRTAIILMIYTACLSGLYLPEFVPVKIVADAYSFELQEKPLAFHHEYFNNPHLASLRKEFDYDEYSKKGSSEFEKMMLLKNWVYSRLKYDEESKNQDIRNSIKILRMAKKKETFLCTNYAAVYMQCALSMGWTSRYVFLRKLTGEQHAGNDIWSNQYRKWVYVDPTYNIHVEKSGMPLSLLELRKEYIDNNGSDLEYVFGEGIVRKVYACGDLPIRRNNSRIWQWCPFNKDWLAYTAEIAIVGRNDFFSGKSGNGDQMWQKIYIIKDDINKNDRNWYFIKYDAVEDMNALFHDLNRVDLKIVYNGGRAFFSGKRAASVTLDCYGEFNFTPYFNRYEIKIDEGEWENRGPGFNWILKPGRNEIKTRIVNKYGVKGPVTRMEVLNP
ncbi:MAG: transglutaminase-like domain-containing protein [Spirochaetes bacterium]|jgi:hypothetical protein|nr:transglutaminase-like domain-containing protein [Spirochaetota bacterium]